MKWLLTIIVVCFALINLNAQTYKWVKGGGTNQSFTPYNFQEEMLTMCSDFHGNVYSLSVVGNNAIIADTFYRPSAFGSPRNVLFTSHNCNGQMRFAKLISANEVIPYGVVTDNSGNVYVAFFAFHGSTSTSQLRIGYDTTITDYFNNRVVLVKYDTLGHLNWVRFVGENTPVTYANMGGMHNFLALDGSNNPHYIVNTGYGVNLSPTVTSHYGYYDMTYSSTGAILGINRLEVDSSLFVDGVALDKQSNKLYAYGERNISMFPDSSRYIYITGLDVTRNRIWIDTLSNPFSPTAGKAFGAITVDGTGHLYATLGASQSVIYKGDTAVNILSSIGYVISVIMKMDTAGNPLWMRTFSGSLSVNGLTAITLMGDHKIAACGGMTGTVVSGTDTIIIYPGEGQSAWFTIVDTAGYVHTIQQLHGGGFYDWANKIVADNVGSLYVGGKLATNIWAGSLTPYTSVGGDSDYFIMKYGVDCSCTSMPVANYTYSGTSGLTRSFTYTGTATGIDSIKWNFGDGGTSSSMTPTHTYTGAGTYTTCVRVYSSCGNDMRCHELSVGCTSTPIANYIDTGVLVHGFTYTGTITGLDSVVWDFGDGNSDTGLTAMHTYAVADTYHVCAKVYTNCGTHTWCRDVYINVPGSVSAVNLSNVHVFPNPATNELYVTCVAPHTAYRLLNVVGVVIEEGVFNNNTNIVQTLQMPPGMYVLEMVSVSGVKKTVRIIKQ